MSFNSFVHLSKKTEPQFIPMSSNSLVYLQTKKLNPNSFVCLRIHSYIFQKKSEPQFIRMSSNSFVYLPTKKHHRMSSNSFVYVIFQKKSEPQFVCMSSNSFVYLQTPPAHFQPDFFFPGVWICCARKVNAVWKKEDPKAFNLKWLMWNLCPGPRANP